MTGLSVTSHVGRDILQSSALFKHEHQVVWEYVSNGLQYIANEQPLVRVTIDQVAKKITIIDNGRGMGFADLHQFFQMHGENIDRASGKPGRGFFGTGKSAAFGIANKLRVTTVKNGKRSTVELTRSDIESPAAETKVPVTVVEREVIVERHDGTQIDIEEINIKKIDRNSIIKEIERHVAHWPNATVYVDHHKCEYVEPVAGRQVAIPVAGTPFEGHLGGVELVLKVAKAPLEEGLRGIAITSKGVLHETTLAGCESKPLSRYVFGAIEVPQLAEDTSGISPFDMSRSMILNRQNETVRSLIAFIGMNVQNLISELEKEERDRKASEDAKRLKKEADKIAEIINSDFHDWSAQLKKVVADAQGTSDMRDGPSASGETEILTQGDDILAILIDEEAGLNVIHDQSTPPGANPEPRPGPEFEANEDGEKQAQAKPASPNIKRRRGGFNVDFREMGEENARAKYEDNTRTILINLDHPQISAAKRNNGIEDPLFKRMAYEVAFSEYAIGLAAEFNNAGWYIDSAEPIVAIRETLNRLSRAAASLYE
ncbi:ATP-binding protein [Erythrobacter sp. SDW2]|uniref:ATP-binding protein n=1 Tax=Erythrobacter sp. SDW2 TaxID=2907154 RepID=UPI001F4218D3|nr:ATP-binding protein [Erythrobacter sp. SDW2]UIP07763.1 ATP-binding protein [Erythrobacter sp. SDW2]